VIDRLFVAVCVSDVQCRDMIEDLVRWAPLPSDSKQLYYIENQQKIDLLERDWSRHNSRNDIKEETQTMVFIKREHTYENVADHLARFRLLLAFGVGSGKDWAAIQHLYRFAAISNLSKSNGYSHHILDTLLRYKEISLKSAMCAIMTWMFHDLSSFSFDFLSNSGLDLHKDELIKIGLLSSLVENFEAINLHYSKQSTLDQISKYRYHPLVNHILEYLNYCSYEEAAKVLEIMLNDKICNLDSNTTIRILDKATTLVMAKYFWNPIPVIMGLKPTEINSLTQNVKRTDMKLPRVKNQGERHEMWRSFCHSIPITKLRSDGLFWIIKSEVDGNIFALGHSRFNNDLTNRLRSFLKVYDRMQSIDIFLLGKDRLLVINYTQSNVKVYNIRSRKLLLKNNLVSNCQKMIVKFKGDIVLTENPHTFSPFGIFSN
jgi:hypothetical protein